MENRFEQIISRLLTNKTLVILGALLVPLVVIKFVSKDTNVDPLLIYFLLSAGLFVGFYVFNLSLKFSYLPYLLLQLIIIWIFLDNKISEILGINIKLYALVFGLSFVVSIFYFFRHFKYLWDNYVAFRLLLIFFFINIFYFLFYHSDFRSWYSDYMDIWLARPEVRLFFIREGMDVFAKSFSETQYVGMYLSSLVPVISFIVAVMSFKDTISLNKLTEKLFLIARIVIFTIAGYFFLSLLFIAIGISTIGFVDGRLWGDFLGFGHAFAIYLSYYVLFLAGLKVILNYFNKNQNMEIENNLINLLIIISLSLIVLQINKTALVALAFALAVLLCGLLISHVKFNFFSIKESETSTNKASTKILAYVSVLIVMLLIFLFYFEHLTEAFSTTSSRIIQRFTTFSTFNIRTILWEYFLEYWYENLNLFRLFFGFGIDASREASFRISQIIAGDIRLFTSPLVHVHNLYFEMFYDYGLMALFYFGSIFYIAFDNIKNIISKKKNQAVKLFSIISLSIITFFAVFSTTEILRIPIAIVFFSLLGFFEVLKYNFLKFKNQLLL